MAYIVGTPTVRPYASLVNDEAINALICQPVYSDGNGSFKLALADGTAKAVVVGLIIDTLIRPGVKGNVLGTGIVTATTEQWDAVCGTSGGLPASTRYYLSATTPGMLTSTAPSTPGQDDVVVIDTLSSTQARLSLQTRVGL